MINCVKLISIADIVFRLKSEVPFQFSERCKPFELKNNECNIDMDMYIMQGTEKNFDDFGEVYSFEDVVIKRSQSKSVKIKYDSTDKKNVVWQSVHADGSKDYKVTIINKAEEFSAINPLLFLDLSQTLIEFKTMILHSSIIKYKDTGIIFTAPSGTGKSTQADLWVQYKNAEIINGDRTFIRNCESYTAYGSPYAGSSQIYKNIKADIKAIVVLRQAAYNRIRKLSKKEAYLCLISEMSISSWDKETVKQQSIWLSDLTDRVPIYMLECTISQEAVDILHKELYGE